MAGLYNDTFGFSPGSCWICRTDSRFRSSRICRRAGRPLGSPPPVDFNTTARNDAGLRLILPRSQWNHHDLAHSRVEPRPELLEHPRVFRFEDKSDLGNAIALNSSMVNCARLLGPSAAGLLIATVGEGICFLINGLSYFAVITSLLLMRIVHKNIREQTSRAWHDLREGLRYVYGFEPIRAIILLLALVSLMGMPYIVLMPIFAKDVLHGGPRALGFLMGGSGTGALAGALYLASRRSVLGLGKMIPIGAGIFGLGLVAFALSRNFFLSLTLVTAVGFGQMVQLATSNTLLQTVVDDDRRGRIMSFYAVAFLGMAPVGSLLSGALANVIGAPWTVFIGGAACLAGAGVFARKLPQLRDKVRPIYVTKGILPEVAAGIDCATGESIPGK